MPIVHFEFNPTAVPAHAQNVRAVHRQAGWEKSFYEDGKLVYREVEGPCAMWLWDSHAGLCLFEREHNMRDDSDFYMTVWNAEKAAPERIMFATTRGWSYPGLASCVDATEEARSAYLAWETRETRRQKVLAARSRSVALSEKAKALSVRRSVAARLVGAYGRERFDRLVQLVTSRKNNRLRNAFKAKLADQVISWLSEPTPRYETPLSPKQAQYI